MEVIARGDLFIAAERGVTTTKPRPVLIIQNEISLPTHPTLTVCLLTTTLRGESLIRLPITPSPQNGLDEASEVQIDRVFSFQRDSLDKRIGTLSQDQMELVDEALRRWLSL